MKVSFKHPRKLGSVSYTKGTHFVPDEFAGHWYFLALLNNKDISILEAPKKAAPPKDETPTGATSESEAGGGQPTTPDADEMTGPNGSHPGPHADEQPGATPADQEADAVTPSTEKTSAPDPAEGAKEEPKEEEKTQEKKPAQGSKPQGGNKKPTQATTQKK